MVSGYLLAVKFHEGKRNYIVTRFANLYFIYVIPILTLGLFQCLKTGYTLRHIISYFLEHILEICMMDWVIPVMSNRIIPTSWYVPILFFVTFIAWGCLKYFGRFFESIVSIMIALFIYNYIYVNTGNLDIWSQYSDFYYGDALIRVFAGVLIGIFCFSVSKSLDTIKCHKKIKKYLGLFSFICQNTIFLLVLLDKWIWGDFIYLFLSATSIIIAFWSELAIPGGKIVEEVSRLTYPIYTTHFFVCILMKYYISLSGSPTKTGCIFIAGVLLSTVMVKKISAVLLKKILPYLKIEY